MASALWRAAEVEAGLVDVIVVVLDEAGALAHHALDQCVQSGGVALVIGDGEQASELAPFCLLVSRRKRALAQKIEFVLIEGPFQAEQQTVVALSWCVDRLLVDQHGIDDAAHLDELLPVAAVAGKPRHLPRRHRADLAETDFGHHAIEAGAFHIARGRAAEIFVDRFNPGPAKLLKPTPHGVLKRAALAIVQNLMGG